MRIFEMFRSRPPEPVPRSAEAAKERLQIILAHERADRWSKDILPLLKEDILKAIAKHIPVSQDKVDVKLQNTTDISMIEVNIELPDMRNLKLKANRSTAVEADDSQEQADGFRAEGGCDGRSTSLRGRRAS